jgi:GT2 family glycosyltransferase
MGHRLNVRRQSLRRMLKRLDDQWLDPAEKTAGRIVVIIVTFKYHDMTTGLVHKARDAGLPVVVVDNSGDYHAVADETVLVPGKNIGWSKAVNMALESVMPNPAYDRFLLLHNDVALSAGFFHEMAVVAHDHPQPADGIIAAVSNAQELQNRGHFGDIHHYEAGVTTEECPVVSTEAMMVSRSVFDRVGLLDEDFPLSGFGAGHELQKRARDDGFRVLLTDRCFVFHYRSRRVYLDGQRGDQIAHHQICDAAAARDVFRAKYGSDWQKEIRWHYGLNS